jgi:hypothetical protein
MKKRTQILSFLAFSIALVFVVVACSKSDDGGGSEPQSFEDFEFSGIFRGTLSSDGNLSELEGYVTIDEDGDATLDLLSGRMTGHATLVGDNYNITVTESTGLFANVTNIVGTIEISTRTLYLTGDNPDGSPMTIGGQTPPVTVQTTGGWENLAKAAVYFTHNETCKVSITINGETLSGINAHYHQGGLCDSYYSLWNQIYQNYDDKESTVFCNTGTIMGLDGNPVTFTDCNTAAFILNKNTEYTYTAVWENGEVSTGSFTTPGGGAKETICLSNSGDECNDGGLVGSAGNPRFNLQFSQDVDLDLYVKTPNGTLIYYGNPTGQNGELDVDCACGGCENGHAENIFWTNGPSGTYEFYVNYYGSCSASTPSVNFTVKVMNGNTVLQTKTGTLSEGQSSQHWTYTKN